LNISELRIRLDASPLYCRLSITVYLFCAFFVYQSSLPLLIKLCFAVIILWQMNHILTYRKPHPGIESIHYAHDKWQLIGKTNEDFVDVKQRIDTGFFQLLLCVSETGKKTNLLLFQDQLNRTQQRYLQLILASCRKESVLVDS